MSLGATICGGKTRWGRAGNDSRRAGRGYFPDGTKLVTRSRSDSVERPINDSWRIIFWSGAIDANVSRDTSRLRFGTQETAHPNRQATTIF